MKETRILMGMPVTVEVADPRVSPFLINAVFAYFDYVDKTFSTYKEHSEISKINRGELAPEEFSDDMQTVFALAEQTRQQTDGFFDIKRNGRMDPSGLVKGWAIYNAAAILRNAGCENYYVDAGGDAELCGKNDAGQAWRVGIRNPFDAQQIVKVLSLSDCGIATSGTYVRGQHIYDPHSTADEIEAIKSLTVVGPNVYEADRFATAAFAMDLAGIYFIEQLDGFEGYAIDEHGRATFTSGFERYVLHDEVYRQPA